MEGMDALGEYPLRNTPSLGRTCAALSGMPQPNLCGVFLAFGLSGSYCRPYLVPVGVGSCTVSEFLAVWVLVNVWRVGQLSGDLASWIAAPSGLEFSKSAGFGE